MFQIEWGLFYLNETNNLSNFLFKDRSLINNHSKRMLLSWSEHCLECAPPLCYQNCTKYLIRNDSKCRNLKFGMVPLKNDCSYFDYGVLIEFRDWAKIETLITGIYLSKVLYCNFDRLNAFNLRLIDIIYKFLPKSLTKKRRLNGAYYFLREKLLSVISKSSGNSKCELVIVCYSFDISNVNYIIECGNFKNSIILKPGINSTSVSLNVNIGSLVRFFPENNINSKIFIYDLSIIKPLKKSLYSDKVKCVVWDLDNTLWKGIFLDHGKSVQLREEIKNTIIRLDELGILNSISSKNNFEDVRCFLEENNLWHYFLVPKINWQPKSLNIRQIAKELNIGLDSILFVDDNPFERSEVTNSLPEVEVVDEYYFPVGVNNNRFNVVVTEESKKRRELYKIEFYRKDIATNFNDDIISFLFECNLQMVIAHPQSLEDRNRAMELIQRTNQLNLSNKRYDEEEFNLLLQDQKANNFVFRVHDRFGDYGVVGFISFHNCSNIVHINDLVVSCRVVQKLIEKSLIAFVIDYLSLNKDSKIIAHYNKSSKNGPILLTLKEIGFKELTEAELVLKISDFDSKILPVNYVFKN